MKNQVRTLTEITRLARKFRKGLPNMNKHYNDLNAEIYRDGALAARHKRLMAMAVAVTHGCTGCMLFQVDEAVKLGASLEEVTESLAVAVGLGGSMASSRTAQVMAFLEEKGLA